MKDVCDFLGVIILAAGIWFLVDPEGMGKTIQDHVVAFQNGLNFDGWE
jgi:hypothetical protein